MMNEMLVSIWMMNKKIRRNSGRKIVDYGDGYAIQWSDWVDYRDGFRGPVDKTKFRPKHCKHIVPNMDHLDNENLKLKKHRLRRKRKHIKQLWRLGKINPNL
jgi:hypothetical protein